MKHYALIILLLIGFSCRSSRNSTDTSYSDHSTETKKEVSSETISLQSSMLATTRTATDTRINEYFRTTLFNADGSISAVQEAWRDTRRNELADSTGQRSILSGIARSDSTITETNTSIEAKQKTDFKTDSRPIQGWKEWGIIALVAIIGISVIVFLVKLFRRKIL